jgi:MFS family permease
MSTFSSTPAALRVLGTSVIARMPLAMLGIALLIHARDLTGSFTAAGLVAGAYATATGVGGPLLGRLVDRAGQLPVLMPSVLASAAGLAGAALLPHGTAPIVLVGLAAAIGLATPPLGACVRTLLPGLARDEGTARVAYAYDATAVELTWILGPPLALGLGALWSSGAALAAAAAILLAGTAAFAAQPAVRAWRPEPVTERTRGGSLDSAGMRTLVLVLVAAGVLFGAVEVAVAAAAEALGSSAAAGPLLGLWGLGSLAGGVVATRRGGGARSATGLAQVLALLAAGHVALIAATGSLALLGATLLLAGAAIAPTCASAYAMVEDVTPEGTITEAFAWLATALAVGAAAGAAGGGAVADSAGPAAACALAGCAGTFAVLVTLLRSRTLGGVADPAAIVPALAAA